MPRINKLQISESLQELQAFLRQQTVPHSAERIQALILIKTGKVNKLEDVGTFLGRDTSTIARWFQSYRKNGLTGILEYKRGKKVAKKASKF